MLVVISVELYLYTNFNILCYLFLYVTGYKEQCKNFIFLEQDKVLTKALPAVLTSHHSNTAK